MAVGSTRENRVFEIWSEDSGRTWGELTLTALPNPSAGTDALKQAYDNNSIQYNHTAKGRSPLNVAVSSDGVAWHAALKLEDSPGKEFSYPAVIQTSDGLVHITYTWQRKRIKHVVIDPQDLRTAPIIDGQWPVPQ